jgi:hypothetical protein
MHFISNNILAREMEDIYINCMKLIPLSIDMFALRVA